MKQIISFIITLCFSLVTFQSYAEKGVEALSPELRILLSKEMLSLQEGMKAIFPAYISGDWHEISHIALKMKNSYILKQSLTNAQRHELHSTLPDAFLKQDQQFHYLAGMLSHAADMEKLELVGFYYSELTNSCVSCHSQFALQRFPALNSKLTPHKH